MSGKASLDISPFINDQGLVQVFTISVGNAAGDGTDQVRDFSFEIQCSPPTCMFRETCR